MRHDFYKELGNVFLLRFDKYSINQLSILDYCTEHGLRVYLCENDDYIFCILFLTYQKSAYYMHTELGGCGFNKLDTYTAGLMLELMEDVLSTKIF